MARNIGNRLKELRVRRSGMDRLDRVAMDSVASVLAKSQINESWQGRAKDQPYTRYAIGSMEAVDADYTRISLETAERVGRQLLTALRADYSIDFRLQGSVPLDVHIRGVSDVDLLNLDVSFFTYRTDGPRSRQGGYTNPTARTSLSVLSSLRGASASALRKAFPAADVDTSGSKAIKISGGSLARPVDVVPSHWHDNIQYQTSGNEVDRSVTILDSKNNTTLDNLPFVHISLVRQRCDGTGGGLRKGIRLAKNVKADAVEEGTSIELPSFDIAAIMYHADQNALAAGRFYELAILAETQRHFEYLATHHDYAKTLYVPDGSRRIFDTPGKLTALNNLSVELGDLAREVAKEQNAMYRLIEPTLSQSRTAIEKACVA